MAALKAKYTYILNEAKLGLTTREDTVKWVEQCAEKLPEEDSVDSDIIFGLFIDHREFWLVYLGKGKLAYKRFKKHLKEAKAEDEKAHPKRSRLKGQMFVCTLGPEELSKVLVATKVF